MATPFLTRYATRSILRSHALQLRTRSPAFPTSSSLQRSLSTTPSLLATGSVSQQPGSKSFKELGQNAKEEAQGVAKDVSEAITGATEKSSQLGGGSGIQGVTSDLNSMGSLVEKIPDKAMAFGAAGLLPYAGTSLTTIYLSRQAGAAVEAGAGSVDAETALALLYHVELLQIQYGAIILSFLGALHWGFEFSSFGGQQGTPRYLLGVAPVLAGWGSMLLPGHLALIAQWGAFTGMWWADQRATSRGWTPKWYSTYRFWLTAIVGSSIILTLGGATYYGPGATLTSAKDRLQQLGEKQQGQTIAEGGPKKLGDIRVEKSDEAYMKFTNIPKQKEAEKKEAEEKKEKEIKEKKEAEEKEKKEKKEKEDKFAKKGGA